MASMHDNFPAYLQAAMSRAGLPRPKDIEDATDGEVANGVIYRWLRGGEPSVKLLRPVARVLGIPLLEMMAASGVITPAEATLEDVPTPQPRTIEDEIRSDPRLREDRKEALITLLESLREEHTGRTPVRTRRTHVSSDQGIDTDVSEELSG